MRSFLRSRAVRNGVAAVACGATGGSSGLSSSSALDAASATTASAVHAVSRRFQWGGSNSSDFGGLDSEIDAMFGKATEATNTDNDGYGDDWSTQPAGGGYQSQQQQQQQGAARTQRPAAEMSSVVAFKKLDRVPAKFDVMTFSDCFAWQTTAKVARKFVGPMREWSTEIKYRTGVHLETEPTHPAKIAQGSYATADDVEITLYAFGSERSVAYTSRFMETLLQQEPSYVRIGVFRRVPDSSEVEWLTLRRINSEVRPPDVPPISLKLTGKHTMLFESLKDAAIRSVWEETGIALDPKKVFPSGMLNNSDANYFWRVPVRYFVAECPEGAEVRGPLPSTQTAYLQAWDSRILRQSPDPIDQAWARHADPATGTAWLKSTELSALQKPLRGDHYMSIRYTPPPFSNLQEVVNLPTLEEK